MVTIHWVLQVYRALRLPNRDWRPIPTVAKFTKNINHNQPIVSDPRAGKKNQHPLSLSSSLPNHAPTSSPHINIFTFVTQDVITSNLPFYPSPFGAISLDAGPQPLVTSSIGDDSVTILQSSLATDQLDIKPSPLSSAGLLSGKQWLPLRLD